MKNKIILTNSYAREAMEDLQREYTLIVADESKISLSELCSLHSDASALITFLSDRIDSNLISALPKLKIIANYAVGYNNIDVIAAIEKGIWITHTPDVLTNATADLTMALILAVCRRVVEADGFLRSGHFLGWKNDLFLGKELSQTSLGIIGMGRIGMAVAQRAQGFGMAVKYYSRTRKPELEKKHNLEYMPFLELIQTVDIVSLHIPYTPEVHHLFNTHTFDLMKRDAIFINVSRGPLMDEAYLSQKLEKKELFGAGLDVFEFEPRVTERLLKLSNVVLLPHIGSATIKARLAMAMMTVQGVKEALDGKIPTLLIPEWKNRL